MAAKLAIEEMKISLRFYPQKLNNKLKSCRNLEQATSRRMQKLFYVGLFYSFFYLLTVFNVFFYFPNVYLN